MERYYQKEIECASQEQIRSWQDERLVRQVRHVWDNVPYYRAKMEAAHIAPDDIKSRDDLYKLPFLSKADLREAYPFGLLAEPLENASAFTRRPARPASASLRFTRKKTLISGTTAAQERWPLRAQARRMYARSRMATDYSPAVSGSTAAVRNSVA